MRRYKPTIWLSVGLMSLTLAIALTAYVLGLLPDGHQVELESRAKVAESLAVQLAGAANRGDNTTLEETLNSVVKRNHDVFSSALRRADGSIVLSAGDHKKYWVAPKDGKSTPTHVSVPLYGADGLQGTIELSFGPASSGTRIFGVPATLIMFLGFLMSAGFIGYFFMLRRTLNELDPGRVIPERVQRSFDTLNECVIILDEKERILLVNQAFADIYDEGNAPEIGSKINSLSWRMVDGRAQAGGYPWHTAIRENRETREGLLSLRTPKGSIHNFAVNATTIADEKNKMIGAIVTLTDTTRTGHNREALEKTVEKLRVSEEHAEHQSHELAYLSSHDSLTDCLNRRSFFQHLEKELESAPNNSSVTSVLVIDLDNFKAINDNYGPATGDRILSGVAETIKLTIGSAGCVSRYTGDQFCVALPNMDATQAGKVSETVRLNVSKNSQNLLPQGMNITVSIGIAYGTGGGVAAQSLVNHAEQAAIFAKKSGRNKSVHWSNNLASVDIDPSFPGPIPPSDQLAAPYPVDPTGHIYSDQQATAASNEQAPVTTELETFMSNVAHTLQVAEANGKTSALIQISIDSWDYLTEALGKTPSTGLIADVKHRVMEGLRERDSIVALASCGDLLFNIAEVDGRNDVSWITAQFHKKIRDPFVVDGQEIFLSSNSGIAMFPQDGGTADILARNAASAMRRSRKENVLEGYKLFSADMILSSQRRLEIEAGIREALQNDDFQLFFQPIVDLKSGALSAAECLLRCNNKRLNDVRMDKVIDVAEKSSLIGEIDMWVLRTALIQMQHWCDSGLTLPKISINLSANQFARVEFMDRVFDQINSIRFSPSRVQIEVTETARIDDVEIAARQIKRLQQLGVVIALDDFGTGQSSLTYLQRLHPDVIKIDRSFITGVHTNHANATLVSAMTVMAHCLGLKVVVEGVEDEEECKFLRDTTCDEIQGYFISKPMPANIMSDWMGLFVREKGTTLFKDGDTSRVETPATENTAAHAA